MKCHQRSGSGHALAPSHGQRYAREIQLAADLTRIHAGVEVDVEDDVEARLKHLLDKPPPPPVPYYVRPLPNRRTSPASSRPTCWDISGRAEFAA